MRKRSRFIYLLSTVAAAAFALSAAQVRAIMIDGSLDAGLGSALAVQGNPTGFADSSAGDTITPNGSQLDAAYGMINGVNLDLFLTGTHEDNGNHVNVFIAGGGAGQDVLALPDTGIMQGMNGSKFSPGFQATFALDVYNVEGVDYVEEYSLMGTSSGGYVGSVGLPGGIGTGTPGISTVGDNNTNAGGITGSSATTAEALSVTTGLELQIPLSAIGYDGGNIEVLADINGINDTYLSNQFLPGLAPGTPNLATGVFDFSETPGEYFTVVPEPSTIGLVAVGLLGVCAIRRRKA
jgi:hypothetical protein